MVVSRRGGPPGATPDRIRIRAAVTSLGPGAFAVLGSALELYGVTGPRRHPTIHVSVPVGRPARSGAPIPRS
ncbi:hypothetical protein OG271_12365 [Micromonospora rifamycinica]|uniref:hypothetical protein n=1 Tax=Micromonospora rifamycinica TaxID=291594 RepID=UPI002E27ED15|nr:hypothetical protein [Micromonospora rifamycinica]